VTHPSKRKGDRAELEVQGILQDLLGVPARRKLGAGRKDDMGDIDGVPDTTLQVCSYQDIGRAIREKLPETVEQQERAGNLFAALFCRRRGGSYVVILTPEMWTTLWREAQPILSPDDLARRGFACVVDESAGLRDA
jgi:hypothetical protein